MLRFTPRSRNSLMILIGITLFLAGIQSGKSIERFDATNPIPTPTPHITPKPPTPLAFQMIARCGLTFLLPDTYKPVKKADGQYTQGDSRVQVLCGPQADAQGTIDKEDASSTTSALLLNTATTIYHLGSTRSWILTTDKPHAQRVYVQATEDIADLVQRTIILDN